MSVLELFQDKSSLCEQLYQDPLFRDIAFVLKDSEVSAHRSVMALSSNMLRNLWTGGWSDSTSALHRLDLSHLPFQSSSFETVVNWCYGQHITIDSSSIYQICYIAHYLVILPLEQHCYNFLKTRALEDPAFLNQAIKDASLNEDCWFLNELNVFSHIKDISVLTAFPVDCETLIWIGENISKCKPEYLKFLEFATVSFKKNEYSKEDFKLLMPVFEKHLDLLSVEQLWRSFNYFATVFPSLLFKILFLEVKVVFLMTLI
ncbi:hypothetical protein GEMRC1_013620 [Eukaryota sp. GEM-RC1]